MDTREQRRLTPGEISAVTVETQAPPHRSGHWQMPASIERAKAARPPKLTLVPTPSQSPSRSSKRIRKRDVDQAATPACPAEVTDYDSLLALLRARANELQISRESIDHLAGLPSGYAGKVFALSQIRRIGLISLGPLLDVLALKLIAVPDEEALARNRHRYVKRDESAFRSANAPRKSKNWPLLKIKGTVGARMFGWPAPEA